MKFPRSDDSRVTGLFADGWVLRLVGGVVGGQSGVSAREPEHDLTMGKHVFLKTVEIGGATVTLRSLDGKNWSTNLKDLECFEAGRVASLATTQRAFKSIGISDRWGLGSTKRRDNGDGG